MPQHATIAYLSPAGSTRRVATVIERVLAESEAFAPLTCDLALEADHAAALDQLQGGSPLLLVGSPVYRDLAIPPVMQFIHSLPAVESGRAAVFVTWGGASSGLALWQMAAALSEKGYAIVGAAKVLGQHSMMWEESDPIGAGRPNGADDDQVAAWVGAIADGARAPISLDELRYQSEGFENGVLERMDAPWAVIPKTVASESCTECGTCESVCPVAAVTLAPQPVFSDNCFDCFNCIRECPEGAISPAMPLAKISAMIRERVETLDERPHTATWSG